jgi:hypothetical protein
MALFLSVAGTGFSRGLPWDNKADSTTGNFLLMSDIHFDPFADPKLVKSLIAAPVEKWESIFKSSSDKAFASSGKDTNYPLMISALSASAKKGRYDFAILTGDYLVHESRKLFEPFGGKDEQVYEDFVTKTEIFVAREVQKRLSRTPVYFSLGNNDSECGDYMMATHTKFLAVLANEWTTLKKYPEAQTTMADAGYYAIPHPTLAATELIVLNDIYWSNRYSEDSCYSQPDDREGDKEMDWLKAQLTGAKDQNEKVILVMHIPPQTDFFGTLKAMDKGKQKVKLFWADKYEDAFIQLMKSYSNTVEFSFAGHTHMDDFRILNDDQGKAFLVTHICPAVSPIRFNNPGFQVMEYDKTTGDIKDMATFYLENLATARGSGKWDLEYDFDSAYGLTGYSAANLTSLTADFDSDKDKLSRFARYYAVSAPELIQTDDWKSLNDLRSFPDGK